jgi:RimJ/RimL family protein N-acetyltransferase
MRYYVLEAGDAIVGAASLHPTRDADLPGAAEFSFFYFLPAIWRQGYGKELLALLKCEAINLGYERLCCWVLENNTRALTFYESQGMLPDGARQSVTIGVPLEAIRVRLHIVGNIKTAERLPRRFSYQSAQKKKMRYKLIDDHKNAKDGGINREPPESFSSSRRRASA